LLDLPLLFFADFVLSLKLVTDQGSRDGAQRSPNAGSDSGMSRRSSYRPANRRAP
jgi:hypothetical protein